MRRLIVGLVFGISVLCGCSKYERIVPEELLVEKNGLQYENGAGEAFSGIAVRLYPSGNKKADIHYANGKQHGGATLYDKKGNVSITGFYVNGKMSGKWSGFKDGKMDFSGSYADDKKHGEWSFFKDGKIAEKEIWNLGRQIQRSDFYDNGKPAMESKLDERSQRMEIAAYTKDGKIHARTVIDIKKRTGKMSVPGKNAKEIALTLTLSSDEKHWNIDAGDKTIARINMETCVISR